ncbi:four-helix bundle copper-binding protein [Halobacillus litoralis]|uniref:four-helix bundle copper-binding protein n=1 Tax=Halobacillus litoralis TaxID=45668 RepID=UPI003D7CDF31
MANFVPVTASFAVPFAKFVQITCIACAELCESITSEIAKECAEACRSCADTCQHVA